MSEEFILGVDLSKKVKVMDVRKALINCFFHAHHDVLSEMKKFGDFKSENEFEELSHSSIESLVKNIFKDIGADYDNPKKEDFIKVVAMLEGMAKNFRNKDLIEKHKRQIMILINMLA